MVPQAEPIRDDELNFRELLAGVQKPTRYIGGEWNEIVKDHRDVALTFALAFPELPAGASDIGTLIRIADLAMAERRSGPRG